MNRAHLGPFLADAGLDALVAVSLENVLYSSNVPIMTQRMIPSRLAFVVWTPDDEATMIVCTIEEAQVRAESWITDIRGYVEFADSPMAALADVLREKGLAAGRIAIETAYLGHRYHAELAGLLPGATLLDGDEVFDAARLVKAPHELETLERAAITTERAIRHAFATAAIAETEVVVADRMAAELRRGGADGVAFTVLATGPNAHLVHPSPGQEKLDPGNVLRTDFGGHFGAPYAGYLSDLARTAVVGRATPGQRDTYARLFEVHTSLLEMLRPGVRACDVYEAARRGFEERGLAFRMPHVGHSIGLSIHEMPMLSPKTTAELRAGMVMAIEPITITSDGIFHVEDMIQITETGVRLLSPAHDWADLPVIG